VLREGYGVTSLRADAVAGLTVAIVALPLSMAIAIASGVGPERGLYTSIVGGFVVSLFGGSRYQIGGPAGAFIVLVLGTVQAHGLEGLLVATMLAGAVMLAAGLLRLGAFVQFVPYPVTVGFTAGIAVIIFASQIHDLVGLRLAGEEPGALIPKLIVLGQALPTLNAWAAASAGLTIALIVLMRRYRPRWPILLIAVATASALAAAFRLPVETIGSHFGGIPRGLPAPHLPDVSWDRITAVLPSALSFALLGSIESLLSAVVADSMSGGRHRSNMELVAQGIANLASPLFGGFVVTGAIARTATNVRSGSRGPVSGMLHSLFLLVFMLAAAPLLAYVPLAALAGVLATVAWNMAERRAFAALVRASRGDAAVVLVTFGLTLFRGLTEGIIAGFCLAALLFLRRMAASAGVEDLSEGEEQAPSWTTSDEVVTVRISGAFFFGSAGVVAAALDRIAARPLAYVLDMSGLVTLDSSAAAALRTFVGRARRAGAAVYVAGAPRPVRRVLLVQGLRSPTIRFARDVAEAKTAAERRLAADLAGAR
ncbi:MAG: STAS domain-containing protein, partial [Acetobacteraceae bacterium]|nr:STAS domain-containing protein [Acetobacteraceae bacterium]